MFASVGTLGVAPNGGGQTIVQLTDGDEVQPARRRAGADGVVRLQRGGRARPPARRRGHAEGRGAPEHVQPVRGRRGDTQLIVDATDAAGAATTRRASAASAASAWPTSGRPGDHRRHRPGEPGGDRADLPHRRGAHGQHRPQAPAHRLRGDVRQRRSSTTRASATQRRRAASTSTASRSSTCRSCMNFPAGTTLEQKRAACRPQVFRYRYPTARDAPGPHEQGHVYGCHELEVYPDDRLTCGSGGALMVVRHARRVRRPRHARRLHRRQAARHAAAVHGARQRRRPRLPDRREGHRLRRRRGRAGTDDLIVSKWLAERRAVAGRACGSSARPSTWAATAHGRGPTPDVRLHRGHRLQPRGRALAVGQPPASPPTSAAAASTPPGATARRAPTTRMGNGGVHFYQAGRAHARRRRPTPGARRSRPTPGRRRAARRSTARRSAPAARRRSAPRTCSSRSPARTGSSWAGTRRARRSSTSPRTRTGRSTSRRPATSSRPTPTSGSRTIFKAQENPDGTFTYWGAAADFNLGERGRNAIDVYRVTLPAAAAARRRARACCPSASGAAGARPADGRAVVARRRRARRVRRRRSIRSAPCGATGGGSAFAFTADAPVHVDLFRSRAAGGSPASGWSALPRRDGRRALERRATAAAGGCATATTSCASSPRRPAASRDERRFALVRRKRPVPRAAGATSGGRRAACCAGSSSSGPVFGGRTTRPLNIALPPRAERRASIVVPARAGGARGQALRGAARTRRVLHRLRISVDSARLRARPYRVTIIVARRRPDHHLDPAGDAALGLPGAAGRRRDWGVSDAARHTSVP